MAGISSSPYVGRMKHALTASILILSATSIGAATASAKDASLWRVWQAHNPAAAASIDHRAWTVFIKKYRRPGSDGVARIAYGKVTPADRTALNAYVTRLTKVRISQYRRAEQRAYWLNLYNALTVKVILDHWPVKSIRDIGISPGLFARGPWGKKLIVVEGRAVSLDDIEHRILRPIWRDPRIHYGVNCASIGCPNLPAVAFTAANSERLLTAGAVAYVNDPRGVRIRNGRVVVSSIYRWFRADFGGSERTVLVHLKQYARPALKAQLEKINSIDGYRYDWSVNVAR